MRKKETFKKQETGSIFPTCHPERSEGSHQILHPTGFRMTRLAQSGSIMLEVVAVLALMGVMGAMLFRQIYQRNQELHNIQMASEIRTVKEAFAAYIQANRAFVLDHCLVPTGDQVKGCSIDTLYADVQDYLPDGWFTAEELKQAYKLTLWNYKQNDGSERRVVYGIVVPTEATLPTTGWNFRRAARVALLVGADGGAYDETITSGNIAGALGSWEIPSDGTGIGTTPTYAAMTGIDIFAPEYDAGEGTVSLPSDWSLALNKLHAYNYFAVGKKTGTEADCYTIQHHLFEPTTSGGKKAGDVKSDDITANISNCQPLFWVGSDNGANGTTGNVYVQNDLNVGADMTGSGNHILKLTAEGVIKQKDGLTIDQDGRIIANETVSAGIGDLASGEHFVVDPAYTSTMNDIRLASRGGARLSDILPNYILKDIVSVSFGTEQTISVPQCPSDYKAAITVAPVTWNNATTTTSVVTGLGTGNDVVTGLADSGTDVVTDVSGTTTGTTTTKKGLTKKGLTKTSVITQINEGLCVSIKYNAETDYTHSQGFVKGKDPSTGSSSKNWFVKMGYHNTDTECDVNALNEINGNTAGIHAIIQTYCVWEPGLYGSDENKCKAAGYTWDTSKAVGQRCTTTHAVDSTMDGAVKGAERSQAACESAGFTWVNTAGKKHCQYTYNLANINSISDPTKKAAACKAAGWTWNGTACSNS